MNNPIKKKFPHSCSKSKLFEMYCLDMPLKVVRFSINEIIRENRGLSKQESVYVQSIAPKELQEFKDTYGLPRNHEM